MSAVTGRFAYESFRLLSVRLRLKSIRLRPICQFDRRVSDDKNKTETRCIYRLFFVLLSTAKLNIFTQI